MRLKSLLFLALLALAAPVAAQTTIFTFPDPAISNFRLTGASLNYNGGIQPWVRIGPSGLSLHSGDQVRFVGQADLEGGYIRWSGCGTASSSTVTGSDPFDITITCTEDGSYVQGVGQSYLTIGRLNSLTVTFTPSGG